MTTLLKLPAKLTGTVLSLALGSLKVAASTMASVLSGILSTSLAVGIGGIGWALTGASSGFLALAGMTKADGKLQRGLLNLATGSDSAGTWFKKLVKKDGTTGKSVAKTGSVAGKFAGGALSFMGGLMTNPIVLGAAAITAMVAAVWWFSKKHRDEETAETQQAIDRGMFSKKEIALATKQAGEQVRSNTFWADDVDISGEGGFERWLKDNNETKSKLNTPGGRRANLKLQKRYQADLAQYNEDVERTRNEILGNIVHGRRAGQELVLKQLSRAGGPLYVAMRRGAIKFDGDAEGSSGSMKGARRFVDNIREWMDKPENMGKVIDRKTMEAWGLVSIDPNKVQGNIKKVLEGFTDLRSLDPHGRVTNADEKKFNAAKRAEEARQALSIEGLGSVRSTSITYKDAILRQQEQKIKQSMTSSAAAGATPAFVAAQTGLEGLLEAIEHNTRTTAMKTGEGSAPSTVAQVKQSRADVDQMFNLGGTGWHAV
jgi:hypothetical protein